MSESKIKAAKVTAPVNAAYVADRDFKAHISGMMLEFRAGKILDDAGLVAKLLAQNAPIVPVGDQAKLIRCPCCANLFEPDKD